MEIKALSFQPMLAGRQSFQHQKDSFLHHLEHHYEDDKQLDVHFESKPIQDNQLTPVLFEKSHVSENEHLNQVVDNQINLNTAEVNPAILNHEVMNNPVITKDAVAAVPELKHDFIAHTLNNAISSCKKDSNKQQNVKLIEYQFISKNQKPSHIYQQGDALSVSLRMNNTKASLKHQVISAIKEALKSKGLYLSSLKINGVLQ